MSTTLSPESLAQIGAWLVSDDTGISSKTMAAIALGATGEGLDTDAPYDPGDFGRCLRLVSAVPELRASFDRIAAVEPRFAGILENWDELEAIYRRDLSTGKSKELYERIKTLRGDRLENWKCKTY